IMQLGALCKGLSYDWVSKYMDLFKFAQDVNELDIEKSAPILKSVGIKLRNSEVKTLKGMLELWKMYKSEIENSKDSKVLEMKMELINSAADNFLKIEQRRNELIHNLFDDLTLLNKSIKKY